MEMQNEKIEKALEDRVQAYDFRNPRKLSKEQRGSIYLVIEAFAKLLSAYLTTLLRTMTEIHLTSVKEIRFGEFTSDCTDPDCLWTFEMDKSDGLGVIEMEPRLLFIIVERLFGGIGQAMKTIRPTTVIEKNIGMRVVERFLQMWDQSWFSLLIIRSTIRSYETNPYMVQIAGINEPAIEVCLEVRFNEESFTINVCIPIKTMRPLISAIDQQSSPFQSKHKNVEEDTRKMESRVVESEFPVIVELGTTKIKLREFHDIQVGDVILMDQNVHTLLNVIVGSRKRYKGHPGVINDRRAVKILNVIDDKEFNIE